MQRRFEGSRITQPGGRSAPNRPPSSSGLQRKIGNRATGQLLREVTATPATSPVGRGPKTVLMKIKGEQQGDFKSGRKDGKIQGMKFHLGVSAPKDVSSGQSTGRRSYQTISFTKEIDASSPQFLHALTSNENLPTVTIDINAPSASSGEDQAFETITLTNARIAAYDQGVDEGEDTEKIELTFEKMSMENKPGKTATQDDWARK